MDPNLLDTAKSRLTLSQLGDVLDKYQNSGEMVAAGYVYELIIDAYALGHGRAARRGTLDPVKSGSTPDAPSIPLPQPMHPDLLVEIEEEFQVYERRNRQSADSWRTNVMGGLALLSHVNEKYDRLMVALWKTDQSKDHFLALHKDSVPDDPHLQEMVADGIEQCRDLVWYARFLKSWLRNRIRA